jgi:hypothetical protein
MACSIEMLLDLSTLSIEELSDRLAAVEGCGGPEQDDAGRLLLTVEVWAARAHSRAGKDRRQPPPEKKKRGKWSRMGGAREDSEKMSDGK